jgi:hypothetical protein
MPYIENLYNVTVGYTKRKCTKCANSRYLYTRSLDRDDEEDENIIHYDRIKDLGKELITKLKAFNINYN